MGYREEVSAQDIIAFWFDDVAVNPGSYSARKKLWYGSNAATDRQIIRDYSGVHKAAKL